MPDNNIWLIAGLGNPGREYARTRHNIGFRVVEGIAESHAIPLTKNKFDTAYGRGRIKGLPVILAEPLAYMNRSGPPLQRLAKFFEVRQENILVVHDDIDLAFGRLKIKEKGGHGGHNGLRSIKAAFGSGDFPRVRVGVGRPDLKRDVSDFVLGKFSPEESKELDLIISTAGDAVVTLILDGISACMNRYN